MLFRCEALLNKVASVSTREWPGELAFRIVTLLKEKFAPKDQMAGVERTRKLGKIALKAGENPETLFEQIKAIYNQYCELTHVLTKDDKIDVVLEKGSEEYGVILANTA